MFERFDSGQSHPQHIEKGREGLLRIKNNGKGKPREFQMGEHYWQKRDRRRREEQKQVEKRVEKTSRKTC